MADRPAEHHRTGRPSSEADPDRDRHQRVKEFLSLLSSTVSAMRIYPSQHANIVKFKTELFNRLAPFLDEGPGLELTIGEESISFEEQPVIRETNVARGLPYLFFKDGLQRLAFVPGLEREEFEEFVEVVKEVALLPATESDIVDALWKKEFAHIHYYCPDDFLETRLTGGKSKPHEFKVDRSRFSEGRIDLDQADLAEVGRRLEGLDRREAEPPSAWAQAGTLADAGEAKILAEMIAAERSYPVEDDFIELLYEVLRLETDETRFIELLGLLDAHHQHLLRHHEFGQAIHLLDALLALAKVLARQEPERAAALETFIQKTTDNIEPADLKAAARQDLDGNPEACYDVLRRMGPRAASVAADIFEGNDDPRWRAAGTGYFFELARNQPENASGLIHEQKPVLAKTLLAAFAGQLDKKAVIRLAAFRRIADSGLRREAVRALATIDLDPAPRLLGDFLLDPEETVRVEAARAIRPPGDPAVVGNLLKLVEDKAFAKKSAAEKEAFLAGLARSGRDEALAYLRSLLRRTRLFGRAPAEETRLAAVEALTLAATPASAEILTEGARVAPKTVADACRKALWRLGLKPDSPKGPA
jgi:hypothetical protein